MIKASLQYFRQFTPLNQHLARFVLFDLVLILLLMPFSLDWRENAILYSIKFIAFLQQHDDSWGPMFKALQYLHENHAESIYSHLFLNEKIKFQYPLTSLLPLLFIEHLTSDRHIQLLILNILSWVATITTIIFALKIFKLSSDRFLNEPKADGKDRVFRVFLLLVMGVTFYPAIKPHVIGQIQVFINCFFTLSVWFWLKRQQSIAGVFVGMMLLIKPQYLLIAVWGLLRKKYSFMLTLLSVCIVGFACSIFLFGLSNNFDYFIVLRSISRTGESFYFNQSMNGLLNRLLFNGNNLSFEINSFPPYNSIIYLGTLLSTFFLILSALLVGFIRPGLHGDVRDFMIITLSCTIASPVAWEHHYGILLVIYAFLFPYVIRQSIFGRITMPIFILSYVLSSNYWGIANRLAYVPILNVLQSHLFVAALIILVFLYKTRDTEFRVFSRRDIYE